MHERLRAAALSGGAALAAMAFAPTLAAAQAPPVPSAKEVLYMSAADMAKAEPRTLGRAGTYSYQTLLRDKDGEIEIHDAWNDIIVVQEGHAEVLLGGTVAGGRVTAPGERRGGTVTGARTQALAPGDVIYIPAGLPHLMKLADGTKRFRYLAVKTQP